MHATANLQFQDLGAGIQTVVDQLAQPLDRFAASRRFGFQAPKASLLARKDALQRARR